MTLTHHIARCHELAAEYSRRSLEYLRLNDGLSASLFENHADHFRSEAKRLAAMRPVESA